jgi:hypothetical protein
VKEPESWHAHANSRDTRTDASQHVGQGGSGSRAEVHDYGSKTVALVATILASVALGAILIAVPLVLIVMDAKVQAGSADVRASVQQQISAGAADSRAVAQAAKEHARVALDKVEQTQVQLGAKGLIQPSTH